MNSAALNRVMDDSTLNASMGSRCVGSCDGGALYSLWPITFAGGQVLYAIAFAAAQKRVRELDQARGFVPSMN